MQIIAHDAQALAAATVDREPHRRLPGGFWNRYNDVTRGTLAGVGEDGSWTSRHARARVRLSGECSRLTPAQIQERARGYRDAADEAWEALQAHVQEGWDLAKVIGNADAQQAAAISETAYESTAQRDRTHEVLAAA